MLEKDKYTERLLDDVLKMQPSYSLPEDFASKMAIKVNKKMVFQQYLRDFLIYFLAILGIAGVSIGILFYIHSDIWQNLMNMVKSNMVLVGGIAFIIMFVLFIDKVLLPYFYHTSIKRVY